MESVRVFWILLFRFASFRSIETEIYDISKIEADAFWKVWFWFDCFVSFRGYFENLPNRVSHCPTS